MTLQCAIMPCRFRSFTCFALQWCTTQRRRESIQYIFVCHKQQAFISGYITIDRVDTSAYSVTELISQEPVCYEKASVRYGHTKIQQFCSHCLREIPREQKRCSDRACKPSDISYYAVLPFESHLEEMFKGNNSCQ